MGAGAFASHGALGKENLDDDFILVRKESVPANFRRDFFTFVFSFSRTRVTLVHRSSAFSCSFFS